MEIPAIDGPAIAFCGIARPDQFLDGLKNAGLHLAAQVAFPDHHRYRQIDLDRLFETANRVGATAFLTTEKDRVRLGPLAARLESAAPLETVKLQIEIQDQDAALDSLTRLLFKPEN
jgi:tetraacyldisaccharide 4'-kinase